MTSPQCEAFSGAKEGQLANRSNCNNQGQIPLANCGFSLRRAIIHHCFLIHLPFPTPSSKTEAPLTAFLSMVKGSETLSKGSLRLPLRSRLKLLALQHLGFWRSFGTSTMEFVPISLLCTQVSGAGLERRPPASLCSRAGILSPHHASKSPGIL